jgi:hypothetical protein
MLYHAGHWIYGTMNEDAITGLAWRADDGKKPRQTLEFNGRIIYPAVIP